MRGGGPSPGAGTKTKISEAQKGKSLSPETRAKISDSLGTQIYVYDTQGFPSERGCPGDPGGGSLVKIFTSGNKAAKDLNCYGMAIKKYAVSGPPGPRAVQTGKLFKGGWILSLSPKAK